MTTEKPTIAQQLACGAYHYLQAEALMHQTNSTDHLIQAVNLKMKLADLIQQYFDAFPDHRPKPLSVPSENSSK